jgi:hypothetical protein
MMYASADRTRVMQVHLTLDEALMLYHQRCYTSKIQQLELNRVVRLELSLKRDWLAHGSPTHAPYEGLYGYVIQMPQRELARVMRGEDVVKRFLQNKTASHARILYLHLQKEERRD